MNGQCWRESGNSLVDESHILRDFTVFRPHWFEIVQNMNSIMDCEIKCDSCKIYLREYLILN